MVNSGLLSQEASTNNDVIARESWRSGTRRVKHHARRWLL